MSSDMKQVFEALLPPGAIWRPAPDGDLDHLLDGIGDNAQELYNYLEALAHLRDPRQTTILRDLEKEYGELTNELLPESERRSQLAALKYALPDTASDELFEDKLRALGFDSIIVTQNDPAIDPDLITGELLVNGPVYIEQSPAYQAQAGGANMYAGNGLAVAGYFLTIRRETYDYQIPDDWRYWRYVSFIGGAASGWPGSPAIATYDVDYKKEQALNRAILAIKPEHSWIVLVVNYIMIWEHRSYAGSFFGNFYAGLFGDDLFVLAGDGAEIQTSIDGEDWTEQTADPPFAASFRTGTFGNGLYVLAGSIGEIQTSPDGITWTARTAAGGFSGVFYGSAFVNGIYLLVGTGGEIQTSPDGITWTARTAAGGFSGVFYTAVYGNRGFVIAGVSGEIQSSPDGITWTARTAAGGYSNTWRGSAFANGIYLLVGAAAEIQKSANMELWFQSSAAGAFSGVFETAVYGNGMFLIAGASGEIQRSDLGDNWKHEDPDAFSGLLYGSAYGNGAFVLGGQNGEIQRG